MQENDPPYLTVGTEVSAKYKGAFCEAKIRKVVRVVKCKVTFKSGLGSVLLSDDQIKGSLRVGANVEARHPDKNAYIEAVINKIQDCSQYTVVFDDGDITTLRRSALCLKSGRHFNESDTLDHLPLTHPEHFSNPVVGGRRNVRRRRDALSDDIGEGDESGDEDSLPPSTKGKKQFDQDDGDVDIGKVVCVEVTDKKKGKDNWFPGVIVSPSAQETVKIRTKDEYLVRSFRDGRYYTVPKKEITSFSKDSHGLKNDANSNVLKIAIEKAVQFIDKNELPAHWDKDVLFSAVDDPTEDIDEPAAEGSDSEDSEEDSQAEEKDLFVAKLYKYMEDRGSPINKVPVVCNRDLDLHKLYKVVIGRGGYNKVTNSSQWKSVTVKMGFGSMPSTSTINLVKQGYKKFIHNFEEFTRKLGCNFPAGSSSTSSRSNRIMFRDRHTSSSSRESKKEEAKVMPKEATPPKDEAVYTEVEASLQPLPPPPPPAPAPPTAEESETKKAEDSDELPRRARSRQESRQKTKDDEAVQEKEKSDSSPKKRRGFAKEKEEKLTQPIVTVPPTVDTPASSPVPLPAFTPPSPAKRSSGRGKYKRKTEKEEAPDPILVPKEYPPGRECIGKDVQVQIGDKLSVYYGKESEGKKYEAKVVDRNENQELFFVHYAGWNTRYDEWIPRYRVAENLSLRAEQVTSVPQDEKKGRINSRKLLGSVKGRGPSHSSASDETVSDSPSGFKGPHGVKGIRKKLKPTLLSPANASTRSKVNITPRKRLSSEGDATISKRHTRKRALSGGEPTEDSSESEGKSKRIRKPKKIYDPGAGDWRKSVPSPDILDFSNEDKNQKESNQVIDLNKLRSEMKGIDKMVKVSVVPVVTDDAAAVKEEKLKSEATDTDKPSGKIEAMDEISEEIAPVTAETEPVQIKSECQDSKILEIKEPAVKRITVEVISTTSTPDSEVREKELSKEVESSKLEAELPKPEEIELSGKKLELPEIRPIEVTPIEIVAEKLEAPPKVDAAPIMRPPLPALLRATAPPMMPIAPPSLIPPIRSSTPITISIPQRAQRPILIKCPAVTSSSSVTITTPSISMQLPPQLISAKPLTVPAAQSGATPKSDSIPPVPMLQPIRMFPPLRTTPIGTEKPVAPPAVTLITTSSSAPRPAVAVSIPAQALGLGQVRPTKMMEGPKLASYPTARIRAAANAIPVRPVVGSSSTGNTPVAYPGGLKKRRRVKSQKFIDSSDSSDEQATEAKRQKRQVYAPKTTFKQVNLQVTQPVKPVSSSMAPAQGPSTTVGAVVASASASSNFSSGSGIALSKKPIPKVTPLMKVQQLGTDKRPVSAAGGKIVSGKYTRIEPSLKGLKKAGILQPAIKGQGSSSSSTPGSSPQPQSIILKKVLPVSGLPPLRAALPASLQVPVAIAHEQAKQAAKDVVPISATALPSVSDLAPPASSVSTSPTSTGALVTVSSATEATSASTWADFTPPTFPSISTVPTTSISADLASQPFPSVSTAQSIASSTVGSSTPASENTKEEGFVPFRGSLQARAGTEPAKVEPAVAQPMFENVSDDDDDNGAVKEKDAEVEENRMGSPVAPCLATVPEVNVPGDESCHSLLCEEEIPGSPTPGTESKSFLFDDSNAMEFPPHKMTLPVGRAESVLNQSVFSSVIVPKPPDKPLPMFSTTSPPMVKTPESTFPTGVAAPVGPVPTVEERTVEPPTFEERRAFTSILASLNNATDLKQQEVPCTKDFTVGDDNQIENSPLPMSSSSSISTGSPRDGDGEPNSGSGENKSKEPSDTDSIDCLPKCDEIVDENTSTDQDEDEQDEGDHKYSGRYEKSSGRSRSPSLSPRKRRMTRRESPDESPPRSYRGGSHRSSIKRGLDADYGRMPPPQPPVNLGKPPHSDKYNFIPVLTDTMSSEERVEICMSSMTALREKWKELKTELSFYDRKKKRIRKRKRELEKREKEALLKVSSSSAPTTS